MNTINPHGAAGLFLAVLEPLDPAGLRWQDAALCAETDPEAFFPEKGGSTLAAKRVCARCAVRAECLDFALTHEAIGRFGIWGGTSERERRQISRTRPAQRPERAKANTRPSSERPSRFPGVTWQGTRWTARWTTPAGKRKYLGSFPSEEAAAGAIDDAKTDYEATQPKERAA